MIDDFRFCNDTVSSQMLLPQVAPEVALRSCNFWVLAPTGMNGGTTAETHIVDTLLSLDCIAVGVLWCTDTG